MIRTKREVRLSEDETCYEKRIFFNRSIEIKYCSDIRECFVKNNLRVKSADKANLFNQYFSYIWPSLSTGTNVHNPSAGSTCLHFNKEDIHKHLSALKFHKSKGNYSLPPQFTRTLFQEL